MCETYLPLERFFSYGDVYFKRFHAFTSTVHYTVYLQSLLTSHDSKYKFLSSSVNQKLFFSQRLGPGVRPLVAPYLRLYCTRNEIMYMYS